MDNFVLLVIIWSMVSIVFVPIETMASQNAFNVLDFEAVGNGKTNDTLAFVKTWESTCNANADNTTMIIPQGKTFMVNLITLAGPCKPKNVNILLLGTIVAPDSPDAWKGKNHGRFIIFEGVNMLSISGSGVIDGHGKGWWDINCKRNRNSVGCIKFAPTMLSFIKCTEVYMSNISFQNSPQVHVLVSGCTGVHFKFLNINSPASSPNTDGIHVTNSREVYILSTTIGAGDDCISIGDRSSNIFVNNVTCGPGHGVSIGSLGMAGNNVQVENINVSHVYFHNTTNGARIKTWQAGRGIVRGVSFQNCNFTNVKNPIIINQHYYDARDSCMPTKTGVHISNVSYSGMFGTSKTKYAINLNCSEVVACTEILLDTIKLTSSTPGYQVRSSCNNAYGHAEGIVQPKSCLRQ